MELAVQQLGWYRILHGTVLADMRDTDPSGSMWDGHARGRRVLGRLVLGLVEESRGEKKEVEDSSMSAIYLVLGEEE